MRFRIISVLLLTVATICGLFGLLLMTGYLQLEIVDTTRSFLNKGSKGTQVDVKQDVEVAETDAKSVAVHPTGHVEAFEYADDN